MNLEERKSKMNLEERKSKMNLERIIKEAVREVIGEESDSVSIIKSLPKVDKEEALSYWTYFLEASPKDTQDFSEPEEARKVFQQEYDILNSKVPSSVYFGASEDGEFSNELYDLIEELEETLKPVKKFSGSEMRDTLYEGKINGLNVILFEIFSGEGGQAFTDDIIFAW